jgi:hypothetical protein
VEFSEVDGTFTPNSCKDFSNSSSSRRFCSFLLKYLTATEQKDNLSNELHMVDLPLGFTSSAAVFVAGSSSSYSESSSDSTSSAAAYTTGASLTLISTLEIT